MKMHADRYFAIGTTHAVCQDFALTSSRGGRSAVYVSDGCSDSPHSDFGARFLATSAALLFGDTDDWPMTALGSARCMAASCNLSERCLHATLLAARQYDYGAAVRAYGDGVIAARRRDGTIEHAVIVCPMGAPDYPVYRLRAERYSDYQLALRECVREGKSDGRKRVEVYVNGESHSDLEHTKLFHPVEFTFPADEYDLVAVMSDGACSFQRLDGAKTVAVPVWDVVQQVMAVGNAKGEFVVRRVRNGFLNRHCRKHGWTHYDDFAVGMIHLGDLPELPDDALADVNGDDVSENGATEELPDV